MVIVHAEMVVVAMSKSDEYFLSGAAQNVSHTETVRDADQKDPWKGHFETKRSNRSE